MGLAGQTDEFAKAQVLKHAIYIQIFSVCTLCNTEVVVL